MTETTPREPLKFGKVEPIEFPNTMETALTTTLNLAQTINELFRPIFVDYEGSSIQIEPQTGRFVVSLFFKDKGEASEGQYKSVHSIAAPTSRKNSIAERIARVNMINKSKNIELSQDTKDLLTEFFDVKPDWSRFCAEVSEPTYNGQILYLKVTGLNLNKLLKKIYGNKIRFAGEENHPVNYNTQLIRPIGGVGDSTNYLVSVLRLDDVQVGKLCNSIGIMHTTGISMVR